MFQSQLVVALKRLKCKTLNVGILFGIPLLIGILAPVLFVLLADIVRQQPEPTTRGPVGTLAVMRDISSDLTFVSLLMYSLSPLIILLASGVSFRFGFRTKIKDPVSFRNYQIWVLKRLLLVLVRFVVLALILILIFPFDTVLSRSKMTGLAVVVLDSFNVIVFSVLFVHIGISMLYEIKNDLTTLIFSRFSQIELRQEERNISRDLVSISYAYIRNRLDLITSALAWKLTRIMHMEP